MWSIQDVSDRIINPNWKDRHRNEERDDQNALHLNLSPLKQRITIKWIFTQRLIFHFHWNYRLYKMEGSSQKCIQMKVKASLFLNIFKY